MVSDRTPEDAFKVAAIVFLGTLFFTKPAHAYIDPGLAFVLMQGLLVSMLGAGLAWILRPWKFLLRMLGRERPEEPEPQGDENAGDDEVDGAKS